MLTLNEVLADPQTSRRRVQVSQWYGRIERELEIATSTALWYPSGLPVVPLRWVLARDPPGELDPKAFLCTDLELDPIVILSHFVRRWQVEVTFEEVRARLGVESQRQWSDRAIARTTPCLTRPLLANRPHGRPSARGGALVVRQGRLVRETRPHLQRRSGCRTTPTLETPGFSISPPETQITKILRTLLERLTDALAYAA